MESTVKKEHLETSIATSLDLMDLVKKMDNYMNKDVRYEFIQSLSEEEIKLYEMCLW